MTALEDSLRLPTLQELHIGGRHFPVSNLNGLPNITSLSLSKNFESSVYR